MKWIRGLWLVGLWFCLGGQVVWAVDEADLILHNGLIYTVDAARSEVEAVAVKDGVIVFVGSDADVMAYQGAQTEMIDLGGRRVLPGLHDSHLHALEAGTPVGEGCHLSGEDSAESHTAILEQCATTQTGEWVVGHGHSIFSLLDATRSPLEIIDEIIPDRPAAIMEETSHSLWVNSLALEAVGFDVNTPNPPGGVIDIDPDTGELTGILIDNAGNMVMDIIMADSAEMDAINYDGLVYGLGVLAENGITSMVDARVYWQRGHLTAWERVEQEGLLTVRAVLSLWAAPHADDDEQLAELKALYSNDPTRRLRASQVKLYGDGITINGTAALLQPYDWTPGFMSNLGLNYFDETRLTRYVTELELAGFDMHIHAIGDRAVREALNAIEAADSANGQGFERRHRLTHLEMIDVADYDRFEQLGVIADFQVAGAFTDPAHLAESAEFIGTRANNMIPLRDIYETGAVVTLSSDWDVSDVNPFVGMQRSLLRDPQSLPDLHAVLEAYTISAAYLMRQEHVTGSLEVGKSADLIILDQDIFAIATNKISETNVLLTMLEGENVYVSPQFSPNNVPTAINTNETDSAPTTLISGGIALVALLGSAVGWFWWRQDTE